MNNQEQHAIVCTKNCSTCKCSREELGADMKCIDEFRNLEEAIDVVEIIDSNDSSGYNDAC